MKIQDCDIKKSTLNLSVAFVVIFLALIPVQFYNQRQIYINSHKENLQTIATDESDHINTFLDAEKEKLLIIAGVEDFKNAILHPDNKVIIEIAKKRINEFKNIIPGISLMSSSGIVAIGDIDLPGTDYSKHSYFIAKRQDTIFTRYNDPLRKKEYYAIIGPIYDSIDKNKIIGRIAFDLELDRIGSLLKKFSDNNTNIYMIDTYGNILSRSEKINYMDNSVSEKAVLLGAVKDCLDDIKKYEKGDSIEQHEESISEYVNYKGAKVFGSHDYVPSILSCIVAERSSDEVLKFSFSDALKNTFNPLIQIIFDSK
jgi:hypothetical protein